MPLQIAVVAATNLRTDPRVRRHIFALSKLPGAKVVAVGVADPQIPGVAFEAIPALALDQASLVRQGALGALLISGAFRAFYWTQPTHRAIAAVLRRLQPDVILANDVETLPAAHHARGRARLVFDAHEFAPQEFTTLKHRLFWNRYKTWICARYLKATDARTTVSPGLARAYEHAFGLPFDVLTNAAPFHALHPSPVAAEGEPLRLVHHGAATAFRELERMCDAALALGPGYELTLLLVPSEPGYLQWLRDRYESRGVRFRAPVPLAQLPAELNAYDVGVFLLPPTSPNAEFVLPNKLFEFIQARLAIAIGPSPDMRSIVDEYRIGFVSSDFTAESLARVLGQATRAEIAACKARTELAASEVSSERNDERLRSLVRTLA